MGFIIPKQAKDIIKSVEGLSLERYLDVEGNPTIGWGHKLEDNDTTKVITESKAEDLLDSDMQTTAKVVTRLTKIALTDNQYAALLSLVFNIGVGAFSTSTILKKLNNNNIQGAASEFLRWNKITVNGRKILSAGLTRRRAIEAALFGRKDGQ